ncbi:MAG: hypothetical protein JMN27_03255 [gamma proteobacterium endosymbiont of Lamellibrachia anaximandri]|nr:hypothetical protein [gamma proteobacterium endosymbiont of Lamellibrachia anaximandri]MBL3532831.1 hypothetical protein [gamma proteobacterium endosymbiont of Lamellibrachia anaximandri]MBL3589882.1 hypothetical protein [gamma proteobacterium endosymbiont of Lamellibrachia anaximandri]MBL3617045.1 hypothetical protein [gamma proteobacterium endosymbiont of Lamellibrachia anaximandri]
MLNTSSLTLKRLAALVWYIGVVVLLIKSTGLFLEAARSGADPLWVMLAILCGVVIGWIKAKYLFIKVCNRNLKRIDALKQPMLWQFYRMRFFVFLALMVSLGAYLSKWAQGDPQMLIAVAVVELSIATALFVSSHCFWRG